MSNKQHFHCIEETYYDEDGCFTRKMVWRPMHVVDAQMLERNWQLERNAKALALLRETGLVLEDKRAANGNGRKIPINNGSSDQG